MNYTLVKIARPEAPTMAPCAPDGVVNTIDDQKNALCNCSRRRCWVDGRNHVIPDDWHKNWDLWPAQREAK